MATKSDDPPVISNDQSQSSDAQGLKNATKENPEKAPFAIPQPVREEQVQNAVNFLSHQNVRGSPVIYRRSFLEKKGLTREEIDEAFRRVPDPPSNATSVQADIKDQAGQLKPLKSVELQTPAPSQPAAATSSSHAAVPASRQIKFQWSQALLSMGLLAASGCGTALFLKEICIPRLKSWIRNVVSEGDGSPEKDANSKPSLAESASESAKAATSAIAFIEKSHQEIMASRTEERRFFEALMGMMDVQVKEMKSMNKAILNLKSFNENDLSLDRVIETQSKTGNGPAYNSRRGFELYRPTRNPSSMNSKQVETNSTYATEAAGKTFEPASTEHLPAYYPKTYMEASREGLSIERQENGQFSHFNGLTSSGSEPLWKRKTAKISEIEPEEDGREAIEQPIQRGWVPPQPPSVVMAGVADAIRRPKSSVQKQQSADQRSPAHSDDGEDGAGRASEAVNASEVSVVEATTQNQTEIYEERADAVEM